MARRRVIEDIFKSISTIVGFSGISIAASHIDETNVKEYYSVLQAMGRAEGLRIDSPLEDVSKVWIDNKPMIQECKSIRFEGESITELPYNALNEMCNLAELDICFSSELTIDSEKFKILQERLTVINFLFCRMSPETFNAIINCKCLEAWNLSGTSLKRILDNGNYSLGNLKKTLIELNISNVGLTIKALDRVVELESLRVLDASWNDLGDLSNWLGWKNLSNLTKLHLANNQLTSIPESIGDLSNLTELNLNDNRLTRIPESIGDLKNLTEFRLDSNQLTSIPESIGDLSNLTMLALYGNKLTSIPDSIGSLSNLMHLDLSYNMLTSVPSTIRNLRNTLGYITITSNVDIVLYGDSKANFGIEQLIEIFGRRLHYTKPRVIPIPIEEAYKKLMRMPIYWDFDRLRQLRVTPIPQIGMAMDEMMGIWMSLPKEGIDESNTSAMTAFIHHIYKPDESYSGEWKMAREYLQLSKNLLGSVLNILSTKSETDKKLVESHINSICEGLKHCNDRKLSELRLAYYTLIDKLDNQDETLDGLINNIISNEKETRFNFTFIINTDQNVHLLNYWKYRLRDDVGFDFDVNTKFGTASQDPFNGHPGNALDAFYSNFTPEHAIEVLTIRINQKENYTHMSELIGAIAYGNELACEEKESMLVGEIEAYEFTGITSEGVKYYLLKRGLILQNQE